VSSVTRSAVAPLYLLACLILGGSAQGVWQNMVLQLVGLAVVAWAAAAPSEQRIPTAAKWPLLLLGIAIAVAALQLVPLPPSVSSAVSVAVDWMTRSAPWGLQDAGANDPSAPPGREAVRRVFAPVAASTTYTSQPLPPSVSSGVRVAVD